MPARMCCSCSVVKIEASVLLLVLVDLRLRTANSTTSICCFKFKKSRRQYSRIKLLTKDLGCPPITTAKEFPLCDFALLHAATPIVFLVPFGWKQVLVAALAFSDLVPKTNLDLLLFAHKLGSAICVAPSRGSNTTGNLLCFNLRWDPGWGKLPAAQVLLHVQLPARNNFVWGSCNPTMTGNFAANTKEPNCKYQKYSKIP